MFKRLDWYNLLFINYSLIFFLLITGPALPDIFLNLFIIQSVFIYRKKLLEILKLNVTLILGLLLLWFYIVSFFSYNFTTSLTESIIFGRFILFIIFSYYIFDSLNYKKIKYLLYFILICCTFVTADSFYQFYNFTNEIGFGNDIIGRKPEGLYGRLSGPFSDLVPGSYLSRLIFFIFVLFLIELETLKHKKILIFSFVFFISLIISIIFFSGERMALATSILGLLICFYYNKKVRKLILYICILSSISISLNLYYHPFYKNYEIISSTSSHEGLIIERNVKCDENNICKKRFKLQPKLIEVLKDFKNSAYGQIYISALHMWLDHKITGIGLNNFENVCLNEIKYKKFNQNFGCTTHPHNIYIQFLVETGFVGLTIFIIILFFLFNKINKVEVDIYKPFLFSSLLTIFWPIMSTGSFLKNWNAVFICLIISLSLIISKNLNNIK